MSEIKDMNAKKNEVREKINIHFEEYDQVMKKECVMKD